MASKPLRYPWGTTAVNVLSISYGCCTLPARLSLSLIFLKAFDLPVPKTGLAKWILLPGIDFWDAFALGVFFSVLCSVLFSLGTAVALVNSRQQSSHFRMRVLALAFEGNKRENEYSRKALGTQGLLTLGAERVGFFFHRSHFHMVAAITQLVVLSVCLLLLDEVLGGIALALIIVILGSKTAVGRVWLDSALGHSLSVESEWIDHMRDLMAGEVTVRFSNMREAEEERLHEQSINITKMMRPIAIVIFLSSIFSLCLLFAIGLYPFLIAHARGFPRDMLFTLYLFFAIVGDLHRAHDTLFSEADVYTEAAQLFDQLKAREEEVATSQGDEQEHDVPDMEGDLQVVCADIGYGGVAILSDLSLNITRGDVVAITGETGSGKSTLMKALAGDVAPMHGSVLFEGANIHDDLSAWWDRMCYIPQDSYLFARSILENLTYGMSPETWTRMTVKRAAKLALADTFVEELEDGYDTVLSPGGLTLSGGQRQRLHLARAFLREADIVLMDEPTSALDLHTQSKWIANTKNMLASADNEMTLIIVTHRTELLTLVDTVLRLEGGRIREQDYSEHFDSSTEVPSLSSQMSGTASLLSTASGGE